MNFENFDGYKPDKSTNEDPLTTGKPVTSRDIVSEQSGIEPTLTGIEFTSLPKINREIAMQGARDCMFQAFTTNVEEVEVVIDCDGEDCTSLGHKICLNVWTDNESENLINILGRGKPYHVAIIPYQNTYRLVSQTKRFVLGEYDEQRQGFFYDDELNEGLNSKDDQ